MLGIFATFVKTFFACILRKNGIATEVDLLERRLSKNLEYVNQQKIPYVIIVGKRDLEKDQVTLKDMISGEESSIPNKEILSTLLNALS